MAMMEISVIPIGTKGSALSDYVAKAVRVAKESGFKYELNPMGTVIEGDIEALFELAKSMHESVFCDDIARVVTTIKIDDRRDKPISGKQKVESVMKKV